MSHNRHDRQGFVWSWVSAVVAAFFLVPVLALLIFGRSNPVQDGTSFRQAAEVTLSTTLVSTLLIAVLGTIYAFWYCKSSFRLKEWVNGILLLPMVLPPAAAGIGLLLAYGRSGLLKTEIPFTQAAVVLAQIFVAGPIYFRAASSAFRAVDPQVTAAARADGASSLQLLLKVYLPICLPSLLSGLLLAWARAVGEFGATILFAGSLPGVTQTVPVAIYQGFESDLGAAIWLSIALLAFAATVLMVCHRLQTLYDPIA